MVAPSSVGPDPRTSDRTLALRTGPRTSDRTPHFGPDLAPSPHRPFAPYAQIYADKSLRYVSVNARVESQEMSDIAVM